MPYITQDRRDEILSGADYANGPGELNFLLTDVCVGYLQTSGENYQTINDVIGALECCKIEFYRRVAVLYEEEKMKLNGDCYPD